MTRSAQPSRFTARLLTVLATALAAVGSAGPSATAAVTCNTPGVALYHVDGLSQLRRWGYASPLDGGSGWTEQQLGSGWGGVSIVSGGGGVLYTIDSSGNLRWYMDDDYTGGPASWDPASGSVIGTGWGGFRTVISDGNGVIFAVDSSGLMHWYDYQGNGSSSWAADSGAVIGSGWDAPATLVAGGSGVIYRVDASGDLSWYRDLDTAGGSASWAGSGVGRRIGSGWSGFSGIGSVGGGVLFARDSTGRMVWYRDADPLGGSASWANGGVGVTEGTGWNDSRPVTDITACSSS